jgi:hypothetical protein
MRDTEAIAKALVEKILLGARIHPYEQGGNSNCDFILEYPDNISVPLEVTQSTDFHRRIKEDDLHKHHRYVPTQNCKKAWYVDIHPSANTKKVRNNIDSYLAKIETQGYKEFDVYSDAHKSTYIESIGNDLGVIYGYVVSWKQPSYIDIWFEPDSTIADSKYVEEAVLNEASKTENKKKLQKFRDLKGSPESHLFIYIDHRNVDASWAMNSCANGWHPLPNNTLKLPSEITHVWVTTKLHDNSLRYVVWRASNKEPWSQSIELIENSII